MLGHLIYNYNQLDDVRIQQEISRKLYAPVFGGTHIVHAYDGRPEFGYKPYLEDKLIRIPNAGHYQGAVNVINAGIKYFMHAKIPGVHYVLVTAADTWCLNNRWLKSVVTEMQAKQQYLATSSWGTAKAPEKPTGFATDFFIINLQYNSRMRVWPIHFGAYQKRFTELSAFLYKTVSVESAFQYSYFKPILQKFRDNQVFWERETRLRRLVEREPVHFAGGMARRRQSWPRIGLYTDPYPKEKQRALQKLRVVLGPNAEKLKRAKSLAYYNAAFWIGTHSDPKEPIPAAHRKK